MLEILAAPFAACLVIAALHCYMGLHVVRRGVIFVDLALAQMAALGSAVALVTVPFVLGAGAEETHVHAGGEIEHVGEPPASSGSDFTDDMEHGQGGLKERAYTYALSLGFAFLGAALLAMARFSDNRVPHEAIIGIVYVVSAALAMLVLSRTAHGLEEIQAMLLGSILFVDWGDVGRTGALYAALAALHLFWGRRLLRITEDSKAAAAEGLNVHFWDFIFYVTFALMVTQSVRIGGVLVVFSFLIIPAACAAIVTTGFARQLWVAWGVAVAASIAGLAFSAVADMPTGASLVAAFGAALIICSAISVFAPRSRAR